jgi:hypothetical protein
MEAMKVALFTIWLCLLAMPAFAKHDDDDNHGNRGNHGDHQGAPAPLIGAGVPFLAAGGVLVGWKLLKRK